MYLLLLSASGGIGAAANHTPHAWWWVMEPTKAPDWIIQPCQWFGSAFLVLRLGHGNRREHFSHTRQVMEMPEAEGEGMSYFSRGPATRCAP